MLRPVRSCGRLVSAKAYGKLRYAQVMGPGQYEVVGGLAVGEGAVPTVVSDKEQRPEPAAATLRGARPTPLSNEHGTFKTIRARLWPWLSSKSP